MFYLPNMRFTVYLCVPGCYSCVMCVHLAGLLGGCEGREEEKLLAGMVETSFSMMIEHQAVVPSDKFTDLLNRRLTGKLPLFPLVTPSLPHHPSTYPYLMLTGIVQGVTGCLPASLFTSVVRALLATKTRLVHQRTLEILSHRMKG